MPPEILILGCGFTGVRVAQRLLARGARPRVTTRSARRLAGLRAAGAEVYELDFEHPDANERLARMAPEGCLVLDSVPSLAQGADASLLGALEGRAARVVYLSTTGVYGAATHVDEASTPVPESARARARLKTEQAVLAGAWSSLVLRPAAIYGPGRGVHAALREGRYALAGEGANFISRIHVDDLAAHAEAALFSSATGAYPVADVYASSSREIAEFCAGLLGLPMPGSATGEELPESRRGSRRVDGSAIRRVLGIGLRYPSYREGIPAALREESEARGA